VTSSGVRTVPQTDVLADKMLHDARMAGLAKLRRNIATLGQGPQRAVPGTLA